MYEIIVYALILVFFMIILYRWITYIAYKQVARDATDIIEQIKSNRKQITGLDSLLISGGI